MRDENEQLDEKRNAEKPNGLARVNEHLPSEEYEPQVCTSNSATEHGEYYCRVENYSVWLKILNGSEEEKENARNS